MRILGSFLIAITGIIILNGCASQKPPAGGQKDLIPPELTLSIPKNQSTQFRGKQIRLVFNELIEVKTLSKELIISPDPDFRYKLKIRSKSLIINLIDTLKPNTTYTFNFGSAVSDITEKNVPENLILAFSTGKKLDTGQVMGTVQFAETQLPGKKNIILGLYPPSDSLDPAKHKPTYYTKVDKNGKFFIGNLPNQEFKIFSIADKNQNLLFDSKLERIGFKADSVIPYFDSTQIKLFLVKQDLDKPKLIRGFAGQNHFRFTFSEGLKKIVIEPDTIPFIQKNQSKEIYLFPRNKDSLEIKMVFTDSSDYQSDTTEFIYLTSDGKEYDIPKEISSNPIKNSEISKGDSIQFFALIPIEKIITDSILYIQNKDTLLFSAEIKSDLTFPWTFTPSPKAQNFGFIFKKGALINFFGDTLSRSSLNYVHKNPENYGQLEGSIKSNKECFLVEVLNSKFESVRNSFNQKKFTFRGLEPGNYKIRVLIDDNCNKKWDSGNYKLGIEPELFYFYPEELQLKANWIQQDKVIQF